MPHTLEMSLAKQQLARYEKRLTTLIGTRKGIEASIIRARAGLDATKELIAEIARVEASGVEYHGSEIYKRRQAQDAAENKAINP